MVCLQVVGESVEQRGSLVSEDKFRCVGCDEVECYCIITHTKTNTLFRFDFSLNRGLSADEMLAIEQRVNDKIK